MASGPWADSLPWFDSPLVQGASRLRYTDKAQTQRPGDMPQMALAHKNTNKSQPVKIIFGRLAAISRLCLVTQRSHATHLTHLKQYLSHRLISRFISLLIPHHFSHHHTPLILFISRHSHRPHTHTAHLSPLISHCGAAVERPSGLTQTVGRGVPLPPWSRARVVTWCTDKTKYNAATGPHWPKGARNKKKTIKEDQK